MIGHAIDGDLLLALYGDDTGDVLLKLIVVLSTDQVLPSLDSENDMDLDLGIGVSYDIPLLRSLSQFLDGWL